MSSVDPRPHTARRPDGQIDMDMEIRFQVIFEALREKDRELEALKARLEKLEAK